MSLYAAMLRVDVKSAKARVRGRYFGSGSIRAETVSTGCEGIETELDIDSEEDPEAIRKLARLAEAGCFVIQTLKNPTPMTTRILLNGEELDVTS